MKKSTPFCFLVILVLSSCNQSFYNTRHHAHRDYVKLGPQQKIENLLVANEKSKIVEFETPYQISYSNNSEVELKKPSKKNQPQKLTNQVNKPKEKLTSFTKLAQVKKERGQKHKIKSTIEVKAGSVLNILGFSFGLISIIAFFICGIILLIGLLDIAVLITGLALMWVCFVMSLLAILFGSLGVGLQHPSKGLGMAGIVMGGIVFLSILMILLIMAVV